MNESLALFFANEIGWKNCKNDSEKLVVWTYLVEQDGCGIIHFAIGNNLGQRIFEQQAYRRDLRKNHPFQGCEYFFD